jgi:endoglucanase
LRRTIMNPLRPALSRKSLVVALAAATALATVTVSGPGTAHASTRPVAHHAVASPNPLANLTWRTYTGPTDELYNTLPRLHGTNRQLLLSVAQRPRMRWFGAWYADNFIYTAMRRYIKNVTRGRSNVLVQMAIFRMAPWETRACPSLPTAAQQRSYYRWINRAARAIGRTHVAMVLQPDLPFAFCVPHHSLLPLNMVSYATRKFSSLPHTSVYLDSGAADWSPVNRSVWLLRHAGIRYARGFALNATHYDATSAQVVYGAKIQRALSAWGLHGKRFIVNTAQNGRPFSRQWYMHHGGTGRGFNNAEECHTVGQRHCVTLGIPPTWHTSSAPGLTAQARSLAGKFCDAFLWVGRPWLLSQPSGFDVTRLLNMARTTPY